VEKIAKWGASDFVLVHIIIRVAKSRMMTSTGQVEIVEDIRMHRAFYD